MKVTTRYCDFCGTEIKDNLRGKTKCVDVRITSTNVQSFDDLDAQKERWKQEAENDPCDMVITMHGWFDEQYEHFEICPACYKRIKALRFKNKHNNN